MIAEPPAIDHPQRRRLRPAGRVPRRAVAVAYMALVLPAFPGSGGDDYAQFARGRMVFEEHCMICHGEKGDGNGELSATLHPRPRSFREGLFKFRTTPWGKMPTDEDLKHTIRTGLSGTAMGMFAHLSEDDVTSVVAYVKSFSRRWKKAEHFAAPVKLPEKPVWFADKAATAARAEQGRVLYANACASCHGPAADGKGPAAATLKDAWNLPAPPADLRQPHLRCGDRPEDVYRVLATGLNGTPMTSFDETLTPEQRWEIIAWLLTQKLPDMPHLGGAPPRAAAVPAPQ